MTSSWLRPSYQEDALEESEETDTERALEEAALTWGAIVYW